MSISIALLAYQEAENLKTILPQIIENIAGLDEDYEIIVIDGKESLDNSREICSLFQKVFYFNQEGTGFADAFKCAIKHASKEWFLILDSDGSHDPAYIPSLYNRFKEGDVDVVIGSRYIKGGSTCDSKMNVFMSKILNWNFRVFVGLKARDISTDYRIYRASSLKAVTLKSKYYNVLQEVLLMIRLNEKKLRIAEVPISFKKRMAGRSKRKLLKFILIYYGSLWRLWWLHFTKEIL